MCVCILTNLYVLVRLDCGTLGSCLLLAAAIAAEENRLDEALAVAAAAAKGFAYCESVLAGGVLLGKYVLLYAGVDILRAARVNPDTMRGLSPCPCC